MVGVYSCDQTYFLFPCRVKERSITPDPPIFGRIWARKVSFFAQLVLSHPHREVIFANHKRAMNNSPPPLHKFSHWSNATLQATQTGRDRFVADTCGVSVHFGLYSIDGNSAVGS